MSSRGERTRNRIVEAAKGLFYHRSFTHTSFSDIVDRTGLSRGNINHYFRTKDDILEAVIKKRAEEIGALIAGWERDHQSPKERLICFVKMVSSNRHDLVRFGCPMGTLGAEFGKGENSHQEAVRGLFELFVAWLTEQFRKLDHPSRARSHALHLLGRTEGISVIAHVYNDPKLLTKEVRRLSEWIERF